MSIAVKKLNSIVNRLSNRKLTILVGKCLFNNLHKGLIVKTCQRITRLILLNSISLITVNTSP